MVCDEAADRVTWKVIVAVVPLAGLLIVCVSIVMVGDVALTVIFTVAGPLFAVPSFATYVKLSGPE
jgi:hypothetical protein